MVDELDASAESLGSEKIHQMLHGYSHGHRLLQSSFDLPNQLSRLFLQLSDLSGDEVLQGFEEYLTGYPVPSMDAYALAKTWYAAEMPRPGCVWTHTILLPAQIMARIPSLDSLKALFIRPEGFDTSSYARSIDTSTILDNRPLVEKHSADSTGLKCLLHSFYSDQGVPLLWPSSTAEEFRETIFLMWSQQWPALRMQFRFCTGSLSARSLGSSSPFELQCVPKGLVRQVTREITSATGVRPVLISDVTPESSWLDDAAEDAGRPGALREFLWSATDGSSVRGDFAGLVLLYERLEASSGAETVINALAESFPDPHQGVAAKARALSPSPLLNSLVPLGEVDVLKTLATTKHHRSFDSVNLDLDRRIQDLNGADPNAAATLMAELFDSTLNPLGEKILSRMIAAANPVTVRALTSGRYHLMPILFRERPQLATYSTLWEVGRERRRELFNAVATVDDLDADLITDILAAILDSEATEIIRPSVERWGRDAVFAILDWTNAHSGQMWEDTRQTLTFHISSVMDWVTSHQEANAACVVAVARIVAPYSYQLKGYDTSIWLNTFCDLGARAGRTSDSAYLCTFLLALGLINAPPAPLELLAKSFEQVHETMRLTRLGDEAWMILSPLVPELSWYSNWDKCERLRRALAAAFIQHEWPVSELSNVIRASWLVEQVLRSAAKVDGGESYFYNSGSYRY